ncbi:MAG: hypothetical protein Q8M01_22320 [Rubrivivax sp.]|nr:hypothetical protein [Rubrivivax sp.]
MEEALVFIVRLWGAGDPQASFRAAVLRAGTNESAWFTQADAMTRYFERQSGVPPSDDEPSIVHTGETS